MNSNILKKKKNKFITSFISRKRKLSKSKISYILKYWPIFGFNLKTKADLYCFNNFFKDSFVVVEIGFGNGEALAKISKNNPDIKFLGIELYITGISTCIKKIISLQVNNLRIIYYDAAKFFKNKLLINCIMYLSIFFPDPWKKRRHHKRRLIQVDFLKNICSSLKKTSIIHIITDCPLYSMHIKKIISDCSDYVSVCSNLKKKNNLLFQQFSVYKTKFKERAKKLNNSIFEYFLRVKK